jgi:uncharacterized protein involved in high-affinity Fe2+ transport
LKQKFGRDFRKAGITALSACFIISAASAKEIPIGEAQEKSGLRVGAVYLQPVEVDAPDDCATSR